MVKFGDVVRRVNDKVPGKESGLGRYIAGQHMDTDDLRLRRWGEINDDYLGPAFHMRFRPGQVLYGSRRTYLRKVAVADFEGICANTTFVVESKNPAVLLPELLPFIMTADAFHAHSVRESKGSVNPYVNFSDLAWYEFALPPLEEQRRISRALQASSATTEALREVLSSARVLVQAAIDEAMDRRAGDAVPVSSLVRQEVLQRPQDGNHGGMHPKARDYTPSGIAFLMACDVGDDSVDLVSCKRISRQLADSLRSDFRAENGDVLLTHKGTLGACAILRGLDEPYAMLTPQVTYYRVLDQERLLPDFLLYAFKSSRYRQQLEAHGRQSTRAYVSISAQQGLEVPFPPVQAQQEVVDSIVGIVQSTNATMSRIRQNRALHAKVLSSELQVLR